MSVKDVAALDPVRALIVTKLREHGLTMKEVSKIAGKNDAYIAQFVSRRSPLYLPYDIQDLLSELLSIPVQLLRGGREPVSLRKPEAEAGRANFNIQNILAPPAKQQDLIPVYGCPGAFNDASIVDWVLPPGNYSGSTGAFGVWIARTIGRLKAGDLVFVRPSQPVHEGDVAVVALSAELLAVGEVVKKTEKTVTVWSANGEKAYDLATHRLMKITSAVFR